MHLLDSFLVTGTMSCGLTPKVAKMLEELALAQERYATDAKKTLEQTEQNVARVKSNMAKVCDKNPQEKNGYDWTKTYEKWDAWEDPDDVARQEQEARERSERAAKAHVGCNHDHSAEQKLMDMTTQAKCQLCDECRVLGNHFYKHGQYQRAALQYHKALVYFEYVFPDTEEEEVHANALQLKLLLNFAACRLKTMHLDDVVHHTTQALEMDPHNVKALYRRAQAYRLKDAFDLAQEDLARALERLKGVEDTQSVELLLLQEKKLLQAKMLAYKLRTKQVSTAMFGKDEKVIREYHPISDANAMKLTLSMRSDAASTSSRDDYLCLSSGQPSTRGLKALQRLVTSLRVDG
ncbi:hypothetical protein PsorP6_011118 [Peronosclerospora sorghi]|uniref:Uncharacterized protein n=1 Tax=Peronosclerospora sorghi TaxID=230839 RepID=A0ACC0VWF7_9STRA|nr:hypothetical protein PsorP6_011118 [Peronosclerospora sorghi]